MERSLILILNGGRHNKLPLSETIQLTLETMDAKELDAYISKSFNSSEDIRKKYASKINPFLERYRSLIVRVESDTGRRFSGSIVITELDDNLVLTRKRVIYKKDMILFRRVTSIKKFLLALEQRDYINRCNAFKNNTPYQWIFSDFFGKQLRFFCHTTNKFKRVVGQWRTAIKEADYYYDIVRETLKDYENRHKELGLPSLDVLYSEYLKELEEKHVTSRTVEIEEELEDLQSITPKDRLSEDLLSHTEDYVEPVRYHTHADEEGYPGDLEDWGETISEPEELDTSIEKGKTKTLSNGHHKLFDSES